MKTEFTAAITQLSSERNLPKEVVLAALTSALTSAYKKESLSPEQDIFVKIDPDTGKVKTYVQKVVVESVTNPTSEISMDKARGLRDTTQLGDTVEIEFVPENAGRITAQIAKQVILQRLREAEYQAIYGEFAGREGEIVTGVVQFIEPKQIYVRLNRTEAILPLNEQVQNEHYQKGRRLKLYLLEIVQGAKGPQIIVSRSHPNLVRCLFEMEIPEVHNGVVDLKAIAREAGHRTKIAVSTRQESIEPVGCCLGPRGIRLQSIINELNGEKIDVIQWHANPNIFIANALSPAPAASIKINEAEKVATVVVPDKQLSLAIGKEGQNARLAARLTGWRINIKSVSAAEAEKAQEEAERAREGIEESQEKAEAVPQEPEAIAEEPVSIKSATPETGIDMMEEEPSEFTAILEATPQEPEKTQQIRFAEDILPSTPRTTARGKQKDEKAEKSKGKGKRYKKQVLYLKHERVGDIEE